MPHDHILPFQGAGPLVTDPPLGERHAGTQDTRTERAPRSDPGTIILHWTVAAAILVSLATGLRLAADDRWFARLLAPILPQGEVWTPHFIAALFVMAGIAAYALYMRVGHLQRRIAWRKTVVLTLPAAAKLRWGAVNVILYWLLFVAVLILTATGVLLYLGWGGVVATFHYLTALAVMVYIILHVTTHLLYGGVKQLLRLFRPQPLRLRPGAIAWPFAIAAGVGVAAAAVVAGADYVSRSVLEIPAVAQPPKIDGDISDPAWAAARPVTIHTMQGVNLGGTGKSDVQAWAVHDAENVYFAFRWQDPTRSIKRLPLIKEKDGWHMMNDGASVMDENSFYEDKFAILFARDDPFGSQFHAHGAEAVGG